MLDLYVYVYYLLGLACNFIKKETLAQVFFCGFYDIFKNIFFTEHLRMTAFVSNLEFFS